MAVQREQHNRRESIVGLISDAPAGKRPGKGVMLPLNADVSSCLIAYSRDVVPASGAAGDFEELATVLSSEHGWERTDDDFGQKVFFEAGNVRLTLVKTARNGDLMVDLRNWS